LLIEELFIMMIPFESRFSTQGHSSRATPSFHAPVFEANKPIMITATSSMPFGTNIGGGEDTGEGALICQVYFETIHNLAFSIEEAPCASTGFFTSDHLGGVNK